MAQRQVIKMGNPILARIAAPVEWFGTAVLDELITDLWDTMAAEGGIGIAAPQIGESVRLVVFGLADEPRGPCAETIEPTVLINPVITPLADEVELGWEGCLSVPGMRGQVPRFNQIRYSGFDASGNTFSRDVSGYHARVVQHECDHLDGILYPQRMSDLSSFGFNDEIERAMMARLGAGNAGAASDDPDAETR